MENEILNEKSAQILRLDSQNARFKKENGFLTLVCIENGEEKTHNRIYLHRAFPHNLPFDYISVLGDEKKEIGIIYTVEDFDADTVALLKEEIARRYYLPVISEIKSVKERYGFSYWKVLLDGGREMSFTMQDTYKNIIHTAQDSLVLVDVDGNRFAIPDVSSLSSKSYRKIEIYL